MIGYSIVAADITKNLIGETTNFLIGNWFILLAGIILIALAIIILSYVKDIIVNSVLGIIVWIIITFVLPYFGIQIQLSFFPSLVVSAIFGLVGMGVLLILVFLGISI